MVQTKKLTFSYDVPWEVAILAHTDKFWNLPSPELPDVLEIRFYDIAHNEEKGETTYGRWGRFAINAPAALLKMAGTTETLLLSQTVINRAKRTLVSYGRNSTFRPRLELDEVTTFAADPANPNRTILTLEGTLALNVSFFGQSLVEKFILGRYEKMIEKGRAIELPKLLECARQYASSEPPLTRCERIALGMEEFNDARRPPVALDAAGAAATESTDMPEGVEDSGADGADAAESSAAAPAGAAAGSTTDASAASAAQ